MNTGDKRSRGEGGPLNELQKNRKPASLRAAEKTASEDILPADIHRVSALQPPRGALDTITKATQRKRAAKRNLR